MIFIIESGINANGNLLLSIFFVCKEHRSRSDQIEINLKRLNLKAPIKFSTLHYQVN